MNRAQVAVLVVVSAPIATAVGSWLIIRSHPPAARPAPEAPPTNAPAHKLQYSHSFTEGSAYVLRLKQGDPETPPSELWAGLFTNMSRDRATVELLCRLFGGLRVQFTVVASPPVPDAKPDPGFDVALRVCNRGAHSVGTREGHTKEGRAVPIEYLVGTLSVVCVIDADPPADLANAPAPGGPAALVPPSALEALQLAAEDYLSRHRTGWRGAEVGGTKEGAECNRLADGENRSPAERRKELDDRIEALVRRYRDHLGTLR